MSNRNFVVPRTTTLTGKPVINFVATMAVAACALSPISARAQSASDVYKKMTDVYANAKSFQGTITRLEKGKTQDGKPASKTVAVKIAFKAPNKFIITNTTTMNANGKSTSTGQTMITDGKALYMYSVEKKLYQRGQIPNQNMLASFFAVMNPANGFLMQPDSTVDGRAAFDLKPNASPKATPDELAKAKKVKIDLLIDKKTYQFLKMTIATPNGSLVQSISGQQLNPSIPDSTFAWSPPAGYKEFKPQAAPSGGPTIPGMPGRAPGQ